MAVANTVFRLNIHPFVQAPDSPFPVGLWVGRAALVGDGSGGSSTIVVQLPRGDVWSLEGASVATPIAEVSELGWRPELNEGEQQPFIITWSFQTTIDASLNFRMRLLESFQRLTVPLSLAAPFGTTPPEIRSVATNTNTAEHSMDVWGYQWERRVLTLPGGPRRSL